MLYNNIESIIYAYRLKLISYNECVEYLQKEYKEMYRNTVVPYFMKFN